MDEGLKKKDLQELVHEYGEDVLDALESATVLAGRHHKATGEELSMEEFTALTAEQLEKMGDKIPEDLADKCASFSALDKDVVTYSSADVHGRDGGYNPRMTDEEQQKPRILEDLSR